MNEKYEIDTDYPKKRTPNLIGFIERDEQDGFVCYSTFESSVEGKKKCEEKTENEAE